MTADSQQPKFLPNSKCTYVIYIKKIIVNKCYCLANIKKKYLSLNKQKCSFFYRKSKDLNVCRLWITNSWPVYSESGTRLRVACILFEVRGLQTIF